MILKIHTFPDPVLRQKALPIKFDPKSNKELETLAKDMLETMYDAPGVGLAANQVGILKRIVVIDVEYEVEGESEKSRRFVNQHPLILINPEILKKEGQILYKEGCLSVPGVAEDVKRYSEIHLSYQDLKGKKCELKAEGLLAVAVQHELDHLDGKLFVDRLSEIKKTMIKKKLIKNQPRKFERSKFHVEL